MDPTQDPTIPRRALQEPRSEQPPGTQYGHWPQSPSVGLLGEQGVYVGEQGNNEGFCSQPLK